MSRNSVLLMIGVLAPAVTACAEMAPAPVAVARLEAAMPPVPAELLAATNGKADPPFQIEAALVLAAQMERETAAAAARAGRPAPVELAQTAPAPAPPVATIQLARAGAPRTAPAPASPLHRDVVATAPATTPVAPIRYAELKASEGPAAVPAPVVVAPVQVATVRRNAVRPRATVPVRYAALATWTKPAPPAAATPRPTPRLERLAAQAHRRHSPALAQPPAITRIRTFITGWLKAIRI